VIYGQTGSYRLAFMLVVLPVTVSQRRSLRDQRTVRGHDPVLLMARNREGVVNLRRVSRH
jgi:hypothetical protein